MTHVDENVQDSVPSPASVAPNPFEDAAAHFDLLEDEFEESAEEVADAVDEELVSSESFFGRPIVARSGHAFQIDDGWSDDLLDREITLMRAPRAEWGADSSKKITKKEMVGNTLCEVTRDSLTGWIPQKVSWRDHLQEYLEPVKSPDKNGAMFVFGEIAPEPGKTTIARLKANVKRRNAVVFDVDNGQPEGEIFPALIASGLNFIYYQSPSNGKTEKGIPLKELREFKGVPTGTAYAPTVEDAKAYLAHKGFHSSVIESVSIAGVDAAPDAFAPTGDSGKPVEVHLKHSPIHKCRIIIPLAQDYVIPEGAGALLALDDYEALTLHVARKLGLQVDETTGQPSRAFYAPRCTSYDRYKAVIGGSTPLVLPACTDEMREAAGFKNPAKRQEALAVWQERHGGEPLQDIAGVEDFCDQHADDFNAIEWLYKAGWEERGARAGGKQDFKCPNYKAHSDQNDDGGFVVMNSGAGDRTQRFVMMCHHNHCKHLDTRDFLKMICKEVVATNVAAPALEDYLFSTQNADGIKPNGKPAYAKLEKLLSGSDYGVDIYGNVVLFGEVKDGKKESHFVCQAFEPLDVMRDENDGNWGLRIEFINRDGKKRQTHIPLYDLQKQGSDLHARLYGDGMKITLGGKGFNGLLVWLADKVKERTIAIHKPGWRPDRKAFVCPDGNMVGDLGSDGEGVELASKLTDQRSGTLEGQLAAWDIALRLGGAHHLVGCLGGVAGALVQYAGLDSTPIVTLSGSSSSGKTTAMKLAAGSFGWPDLPKGGNGGLLHSLRSTPNAVEFLAARSNGTFLGLDETAHGDASTKLEELIFMLAGGNGKHRMKADASERAVKVWLTFAMLSSEHPLAKLVERMGRSARIGFTARVADIDVSKAKPIPQDDYLRMTALLSANYGHVGPKFVEHLVESGGSPEAVRAAIEAKAIGLAGKGASSLVWRSAGVFAVLWQVGEMLATFGLLPASIDAGEVERRLRELWEGYKEGETAEALSPETKAIEVLREALYARMGRDVHARGSADGRNKFAETVAWYEPPEDTEAFPDPDWMASVFYVRTDKLAELAGDAISASVLCGELEAAGIIERAADGKFSHRRVRGVGLVRHYCLDFEVGDRA